MIRITLFTKQSQVQTVVETFLQQENIEYCIQNNANRYADIYFIEIQRIEDLIILNQLKKLDETLVYIIGPKDFDIASECIRLKVNLYLTKDNFETEFQLHKTDLLEHIQERFQYYQYQRHGMISQIRLSQIYYVESLRHQIIIHSLNGTFIERKNLSLFLKDIQSSQFVQIHKSYIVNKRYIKSIENQEVILKNKMNLPIGRAYKNIIME